MTLKTANHRWELKKLGDACVINPSKREIDFLNDEMNVTFLPMSAISNDGVIISKQSETFSNVKKGYTYFREGDVLLAKITPCMENGKRWLATSLINNVGFGSTEFHVLRAKSGVMPEWIYYFISQQMFRDKAKNNMTGTAGQKRISKDYLKNLLIPIPPLDIQRKIVPVLKKTEILVIKKMLSNELINKIPKAIFIHLFENPLNNPMNWKKCKLIDVSEIIMGQSPPSSTYNFDEIGLPFFQGKTEFTEIFPKIKKWCSKPKKIAQEGDILMSVRAPVGPVNRNRIKSCIGRGLCAIRPNKMDERFLFYQLQLLKEEIANYGVGSTFRAINKKQVENIQVICPPKELQTYFAGLVEEFEIFSTKIRKTNKDLREFNQSLTFNAYNGELQL